MTLRRAWWWLPAAGAAAVTAAAALARPADRRTTDLAVYLGATAGLDRGTGLYDFAATNGAPFTYPPFAGLLFAPLTRLPTGAVQAGWTAATVAVVIALAVLVARAAPLRWIPRWAPRWAPVPADRLAPVAAAALFLSAPVASNLRFGQASLFVAALTAVDLLGDDRRRYRGALVGLAAAVKLTPLIAVALLWAAGRRRAAATATGTFAGCAVLAAVTLPGDSLRYWTATVTQVRRLGPITGVGNQSLNGALLRLDLPAAPRTAVVVLVGGAVAVLALRRAARLSRAGDRLAALTVTGAAGVVLSPVSWTHHQVWLVVAAVLPVAAPAGRVGAVRAAWAAAVLAVMLLPVTALAPLSEARLALAVLVAAVLPVTGTRRSGGAPRAGGTPAARGAPRVGGAPRPGGAATAPVPRRWENPCPAAPSPATIPG